MSWKKEYVKWYKIAEEVLAGYIRPLNENEINKFVSQNNWLIIPAGNEKDRKESVIRSDANMYFALSEDGKIDIAIVCNTLESVRRMKNLLHGFHTIEKENFIRELRRLDKRFKTRVVRKIKEHHFAQTPDYETEFEFTTNMIDEDQLLQAFRKIDEIMEESSGEMKQGKSWRTLAPVIDIAYTTIDKDEAEFREILKQLKPAYQIALRIKTDREIAEEIARQDERKNEEKQKRFSEFVQSLKEKGIGGEEYREAIEQWRKENP